MPATQTWKSLVTEIVMRQPRVFRLRDVLRHSAELASRYPANRFVDAKIRQSLQVLRDQGLLKFLGAGAYERLGVQPVFTPFFDPALANGYKNRAQVARVLIETWAEMNLYCLACLRDSLECLPPNTPVADFVCPACLTRYQLKSKDGRFGGVVVGASYDSTVQAVRDGTMPEYVLVEFDRRRSTVVYVDALPGSSIDETRIIARRPLAEGARRAGWRGCNIDVRGLPAVTVVAPRGLERSDVRADWNALTASVPEGEA